MSFDEIVAFAEVERFLDTPVKRYSSGMYVRLAFAVAAHIDPEILIVDEVLAVGDIQFQDKCLDRMKEVSSEGRTVIFVSHNLTAIKATCNRAILLQEGQIVEDGDVGDVVGKYITSNKSIQLFRKWENYNTAPKNENVVINQIRIINEEGDIPVNIFTDVSFNIEVSYQIITDGVAAGLNIIFYDDEGVCITASINNHEPNWYGKPMPIGKYKSTCKIPKNFFNNGFYRISLIIFGKNYSGAKKIDNLLDIEILDGPEVRGDYFGEYACKVRPYFKWNTETVK